MRIASLDLELPTANLSSIVAIVLLAASGVALAVLPLTLAGAIVLGVIAFLLTLVRVEYGIYLTILSVPFGSIREITVGPAAVTATDFLAPLVFAAWALRLIAQREARVRFTPLFPFAVLFFCALVLSTTVAYSLPLSTKELLKWSEFLLLFLVVANVMTTRRQVALVVGCLLLATSLEAVHGWYQFLLRKGPDGFLIGGRFLRAFGTFGQPNPYAGYLGLTLPLAIGLIVGTKWDMSIKIDWGLIALVGGASLILAALLMSLSRGAWLGLAVAVAFIMAIRSRKSLMLLMAGVVIATIVGLLGALDVLPAQITGRLATAIDYFGIFDVRQVTLTPENWAIVERMAYWQSAWEMFRDHAVLGVGIGNFGVFYLDYAFPDWRTGALGHAHNYYLNLLAETGIVGLTTYLIFLLAIFVLALHTLIRLQRSDIQGASQQDELSADFTGWARFSQPYPLALGITGVLLALSVHNFFDVLYVHGMTAQIGIVLGLLAAIHPAADKGRSPK